MKKEKQHSGLLIRTDTEEGEEKILWSSQILRSPLRCKSLGYELTQRLKKIFKHYRNYVIKFPYKSFSRFDKDARRDMHPEREIAEDEKLIKWFWKYLYENNIEDINEQKEIMTYLYKLHCTGMTPDEFDTLNTNKLFEPPANNTKFNLN